LAPVVTRRVAFWWPWLAGLATLVAAIHAIEPLPVGVFYDDAQYLVLAKSLASGNGYRFLNLPGMPLATHFPPGYPVFLALLWRIAPAFPENVAVFKFANAVLLALVAVLASRYAERQLGVPRALACVAGLAGAATIPSLVLSSSIMSEPLFLALLFPLLAWSEGVTHADDDGRADRDAFLLGLGAGALTLVRTHGIALVAAIVLVLLLRRRWRGAAVAASASTVVLAPWMLWVSLHNDALPALVRGAYGSYVAWLLAGWRAEGWRLLAVTLPDNIATVVMTIVRSTAAGPHPLLEALAGALYFGLSIPGAVHWWRRARITMLFVAFYFVIVLVWPFSPLRFVWAIWPLLMLFPAAGIVSVWRSGIVRRLPAARRGLVVAAVTLAAGIVAFNARGYVNAWWGANARFHARRVLPQLSWVARSTRPGDLIAADAEAAVYLYTGRQAVPITTFTAAEYVRERTLTEEMQVVARLLAEYHPRYVVVTAPPLLEATSQLARVYSNSIVRIDSVGRGAAYSVRACTTNAGCK
jgi:hypothetical protein